jgi:hypothetical protein
MAIGMFILWLIDAATPAGLGADPSLTLLLAISFLLSLAVVGFTSVSRDMQLSLQTMMLYFAFFLILPGYSHASRQQYPFLSVPYSKEIQGGACWMLLLFLIFVMAGYLTARRTSPSNRSRTLEAGRSIKPNLLLAFGLWVCAMAGTVVYVLSVGPGEVFSTRGDLKVDLDTVSMGLFMALPRAISTISVIYSLVIWRFTTWRRTGLAFIALNALPCIITLWPPALPRFTLFGIILFVSIMFANYALPSRRLALSALYLFGALVAMPIVNALTRGGASIGDLGFSDTFSTYVETGDFDGLQSLNNAVMYVQFEGVEHGRQLLSALLFFVPRAIWAGKAEPTGSIAADLAGYNFANISMPLPGEFYVDFGLAGAVVGAFVVGWLLCRIDRYIDAHWIGDARGRLAAGAMVGFAIAFYRGTLIGVMAPTATLIVLIVIVNRWGLRPAAPAGTLARRSRAPLMPAYQARYR